MTADPGSFRDPDSRVHIEDGRILRRLSGAGVSDYAAFEASSLAKDPRIIGTQRLDETTLEHDRVPFVSYPYEWPFGMLKQAALLQLDLLGEAMQQGLSLKDATPYNVQWVDGRPVFIDVGSFEPLRPDEPWVGYRQFCCLFLYPLMLTAYRDVDFQPFLRGSLEGIDPATAAALLPRKKGVTVNARLLARLERRSGDTSAKETNSRLAKAGFKPEIIQAQVRRLRKLVEGLTWDAASAWAGYDRGHVDTDKKLAFVREAARDPQLVFDLGANDGAFSKDLGGRVVAMDADHATIERLHHEQPPSVLSLVIDVCDPSPSRGWALAERSDLLTRGRPDLTLSLALVHHLVITRNVPEIEVTKWLRGMGGRHVVEIPSREDPMVRRLLDAKRSRYPYDPAAFELDRHFEVIRREDQGTRVLWELA